MFGDRLKYLRKSVGITQEQLAAIIGVERSSIGKYEGKDKIIPSDDVKAKLADYFGVSIDYLLERTNDPAPPTTKKPAAPEGEPYTTLVRGVKNLTAEQQQQLLDMAKVIFRGAFGDEQ